MDTNGHGPHLKKETNYCKHPNSQISKKIQKIFFFDFPPFYPIKVFTPPEKKSIFPKKFQKNFSQVIDPPLEKSKIPLFKGGYGREYPEGGPPIGWYRGCVDNNSLWGPVTVIIGVWIIIYCGPNR